MLVTCPHCGFLAALIVSRGDPPPRCPRCDGALPRKPAPRARSRAVAGAPLDAAAAEVTAIDLATGESTAEGATVEASAMDPAAGDRAVIGPSALDPSIAAGALASATATADLLQAANPRDAAPVATPASAAAPDPTPVPAPAPALDPALDAAPGAALDAAPDAAPDPVAAIIASADAAIAPAADHPAPPPGTPDRSARATPSFARPGAAALPTGPRWPALLVATVLLLALLVQLLLVQHARLAASAQWRPLLAAACAPLRCTLPAWREPAAFTMLTRSVQPAPQRPGVLAVRAGFRNDARWAQPWPLLQLSLADVDGQPVGQRVLHPHEYHRAARSPQLAPGETAEVRFEVVEPGAQVVSFSFEFG